MIKCVWAVCALPMLLQAQPLAPDTVKVRFKSVYLELLGPSNLIGISFDSRFTPRTSWGYRVGVSGFRGGQSSLFGSSSNYGIFFPLEVNVLSGKKKHKLELGTGAEIGYVNEAVSYWDLQTGLNRIEHKGMLGYFFYSNLGYRYQANPGFQFRIGANATYSPHTRHAVKRSPFLAPYVSLGYAF